MKHWTVDEDGDILDEESHAVAITAFRPTREEMFQNARLIAAAPDLLEACKRVVELWEDASLPYGTLINQMNTHMHTLKAAIKKAEEG